jgi:2,3-bisphosphoglycerate-dependent phosphoglycerate mutase
MTVIYFIRHCESDRNVLDPQKRPLTEKGSADRLVVDHYLSDKKVEAVLSSPYKRAYDTVAGFAAKNSFTIEIVDDFRERLSDSNWQRYTSFYSFNQHQWADFKYTLSDGESLATVQERNIRALKTVIQKYQDKCIAIGTHGTALSLIINYFDHAFGFDDFMKIVDVMPWVVKMVFDGDTCLSIEKIDILNGEG